jgi:hypothetical protein
VDCAFNCHNGINAMRRLFTASDSSLHMGQGSDCMIYIVLWRRGFGFGFVPDGPADAVEQSLSNPEDYLLLEGQLHMYSAANSCCALLA